MDGGGPESLDITWEKQSGFTCPCPVGCFVFLFWIPDHTGTGNNFLGRKEGGCNQLLIYSNCWLCSSPTETMCLWKPSPRMRAVAKVVQWLGCCQPFLLEVYKQSRIFYIILYYFIIFYNPHPAQEWTPAVCGGRWVPDPFREGRGVRIPFQVYLGRAGGTQLLLLWHWERSLCCCERPQNVSRSCRHHQHEILTISWRAQSWLMVRNSPYDKSEAKYNWKKEDGGVAIAGWQK